MNVLNKLKRGLAALLSLSVAMSAVFVFHFPMMKAYAASGHTHGLCGDSGCTDHGDVEWTEWTETDRLPGEDDITDEDGNEHHYFYLSKKVKIDTTWEPVDGTYLCLNGYSITMTDGESAVSVIDTFTLCDCNGGGIITHENGKDGSGVEVGYFSTFNMYGGKISGNTNSDDGGGVYNRGEFYMYGGEISGNEANGDGGGVYNWLDSSITVGGTAKITGNTGGNVFLKSNTIISVDETDPLKDGALIGVTTHIDPSGSTYIDVTGVNDNDYREFFKSDNPAFSIKINNKSAIVLAEIRGSFNDHSDHRICGHTGCSSNYANVEWEEWEPINRLPEASGYYFLEHDVTLTETWVPAKDTHICMNDNSIKMQGDDPAISVENGLLTLCNGLYLGSEIVHTNDYIGSGVRVKSGSELAMYDITITNNKDYGVEVESGGTLTVGSEANVTGNTMGNVYLHNNAVINIDGSEPLKETAMIGVTMAPDASGVTINGNGSTGYVDHFTADDEGCSFEPGEDGSITITPKDPEGDDEPDDKHTPHDGEEWKPFALGEDGDLPTDGGRYYLTQDITDNVEWTLDKDTYLCLNGHTISGKLSVANSNLTLCNCETTGIAEDVTVSAGKTITVGGMLKANITLGSEAHIDIDSGNPLTTDDSITVSPAEPLADGGSMPISNAAAYSSKFKGAAGYTIEVVGGVVTLKNSTTENPVDPPVDPTEHDPHGGITQWEPIESTLPTDGGHYFLTKPVTIPTGWEPAENTYICLNGQSISGTIGNSNVTLCDCTGKGTATVTVSAGGRITVGGKLKANIMLNKDACINVDDDYPLTTDESITVTTEIKPEKDAPVPITDKIDEILKSCFKSNEDYKLEYEDGVLKLTYEKVENPPVVDPPVDPTKHIHPICGDIDCRVRHNAPAEWTAWESAASLPTISGSYYLTEDVELSDAWTIPDVADIELCLNGHDITLKDNGEDPVVIISGSASLILCDCAMYPKGSNTIVNNLASAISAEYVRNQIEDLGTIGGSSASGVVNDGLFMMYGGVITNNHASGVRNSSDFVMNGGVIIGNSATSGGGVYNRGISSTSASFTMDGGVIVDNNATSVGGGLYNEGVAVINDGRIFANSAEGEGGGVYQDGTLTVDHGAYISKNKVGSAANNVFLPDGRRINIGTSLSGTVGVTLETTPTGSGKVDFATGEINSSTPNKIKSDNSSFTVKQSGGALSLYKNTSSSGSSGSSSDSSGSSTTTAHDWELEIIHADSSQIPQRDRTAIIDLLKTMPDWVVGAYYDVTLYDNGYEVDESTRLLDVEMTIPSSIRAANRAYKVIRVHGGKAALLDDIDSDPNTVTVRSRYFSTYAIIYSVSKSGSANGASGSGSGGGYGNPAMGVQNDIPIAGLACGFTVLALAAPGKKIENI